MKIVKISLIALAVAAAGSVFAGANVSPEGLEKVNERDWDVAAALTTTPLKSQDILHFRSGILVEDIYLVKTFQKSAHMSMVTETVTRPESKDVPVFVDSIPTNKQAPWAYRKASK
jgi:hypothetical protein